MLGDQFFVIASSRERNFSLRYKPLTNATICTFLQSVSLPHVSKLSLVKPAATRDTAACVAEPLHWAIVRPSCELLLHRLRQHRSFHVRVGGCLRCELLVKVGSVKFVDHIGLEAGLVFAVKQLSPIYAMEEWMCL